MPGDSHALAPQRTARMPTNGAVTQSIAGLQDNAGVTFAIMFLAYALVGWFLLVSDQAWFHVELFSVSEYISSGPRASSLAAKLGALLDWRTFDVSPYRLRTVSDFVEIIDAVTRPAMRAVWGMHPSATLLGLAMAAAIPGIFYAAAGLGPRPCCPDRAIADDNDRISVVLRRLYSAGQTACLARLLPCSLSLHAAANARQ
jgi:hypothetical protein